jgi:glyoxylase-like metal-dependent hydrolase (beta-lactamase superfamily II)
MDEVFPGIFLIKQESSFKRIRPVDNIYILAGHNGIIYDAGYGNRKSIRSFLKELNEIREFYQKINKPFEITRILVSHGHPDHFSGLKRIRKTLGVRIVLTQKTAEIIRNKKNFRKSFDVDSYEDYFMIKKGVGYRLWNFLRNSFSNLFFNLVYGLSYIDNPDKIIDENTELSINGEKWQVFHSPGHAIDHISLYNEEKGVLLSGDNVLSSITTWLGPPNCNIEDYNKSIESIRKLPNLKIILAAHGTVIENPLERLNEILEHRKERTEEVLEIIKESSTKGIFVDEIIRKLYPASRRVQTELARGWVSLTIKILEIKNLVKRREGKKKIKFYPFDSFQSKL